MYGFSAGTINRGRCREVAVSRGSTVSYLIVDEPLLDSALLVSYRDLIDVS